MSREYTDITDLDVIIPSLPRRQRELFQRIFHITVTEGRLVAPSTMHPWIEQQFGSVEAVTRQPIVKVANLVTMEGALFNALRARRPIELKDRMSLEAQLINGRHNDPLGDPLTRTPEDVFGRVEGEHSVTASNIAKYDSYHAMVIFNEYNPLHFSAEHIADYIDTGLKWARKAHSYDPEAKYLFFMMNCLWKAGASLIHGHAQVMLTREIHYAKIEALRRAALAYHQRYESNYFDDLYDVHQALGLSFKKQGVSVLAYLTPLKDKETLLIGRALNDSFKERTYEAMACFRDRLGVHSFNLALYMPPIAETEENWSGFPVMVRLVDRGDLDSRASDFGAMELYAQSVVASDPFRVAATLRRFLTREI